MAGKWILALATVSGLALSAPVLHAQQTIDFGDDSGDWANDGECDDKRFEGAGMTTTPLLDEDIGRDATDCRTAFEAGKLTLRADAPAIPSRAAPAVQTTSAGGIDFGDDSSQWANDDECDDKRFVGPGMTSTPLLDSDIGKDATDCRKAFEAGRLTLRADAENVPDVIHDGVNFGNDSGDYANDGECDDNRFIGKGMAAPPLSREHVRRDATDCRAAYVAGSIKLRDVVTEDVVRGNINFGRDTGDYANDGECDDKRFVGEGMTSTPLLEADIRADATDCVLAYDAGRIRLRVAVTSDLVHEGINFGTDGGSNANDNECDDPRFVGEGMASGSLRAEDIRADATDCVEAFKAGRVTLVN